MPDGDVGPWQLLGWRSGNAVGPPMRLIHPAFAVFEHLSMDGTPTVRRAVSIALLTMLCLCQTPCCKNTIDRSAQRLQGADICRTLDLAQLLSSGLDDHSRVQLLKQWAVTWAVELGLRTWQAESDYAVLLLGVRHIQDLHRSGLLAVCSPFHDMAHELLDRIAVLTQPCITPWPSGASDRHSRGIWHQAPCICSATPHLSCSTPCTRC